MTPDEVLAAAIAIPKDTSEHLQFLHDVVVELDAKVIVELGTRWGDASTLALLVGATKTGGHVYSCDTNINQGAQQNVANAGLEANWTLTEADDLAFGTNWGTGPIDVLFVDTAHTYEGTVAELALYAPLMATKSCMALHDTVHDPVVLQAIQEWLPNNPEWSFEHRENNNGLGILKRGF